MRKALLLAWGATAVAGCFYPGDRGRQLEQRVDQLTDEEKKLDGQMTEIRTRSEAKIAEMNKALGELDTAEHRTGADIGVQLQKVAEEVAQLRGQVESYLYKMNELDGSLKKMSDDVDAKLTAIKGTEAVKEAEAKKKADELKRPADKKEFFALAEDKAKGGDSALARELYNEFLKKWPKDDLVGDAHYGVGESYFTEEKCREALSEYGKVIQDFPKSRSAPGAYLRSAECFKKLKMAKESKLAL
jgi:TolA-binding protein